MQTYVYQDMEVKLTGRVAVKKSAPKPHSSRRREIHPHSNEVRLVEVETMSSVAAAQTMWVAEEELFIVQDANKSEDC